MPAIDRCHNQVIRALEKAGLKLIQSPYNIFTESRVVYIDAALTRQQNGSQESIIIVEIKCFPDANSTTRDLYISIGQYLIYRAVLETVNIADNLYLTVPAEIYRTIFDEAVMTVVNTSNIKMIIINLEEEVVTQWIP